MNGKCHNRRSQGDTSRLYGLGDANQRHAYRACIFMQQSILIKSIGTEEIK